MSFFFFSLSDSDNFFLKISQALAGMYKKKKKKRLHVGIFTFLTSALLEHYKNEKGGVKPLSVFMFHFLLRFPYYVAGCCFLEQIAFKTLI